MITAQFHQHSTNNGSKNRQPNSSNRRNTPPSGSYNPRNQFSTPNNNSFTQQNTTKSNNQRVQCQLCDKFGHIAKVCRSKSHSATEAYANFVNRQSYASNSPSPWVVDFGVSHHITNNSHSLQTPTEFSGTDAIIVGDGKRIPITHIGHTTLSSPNFVANFLFKNDLSTGECLLQGKSNGDLYEWPMDMTKSVTPRPQAHFVASTTPPLHLWHARLSHHQPRITKACLFFQPTNPIPIPATTDLVNSMSTRGSHTQGHQDDVPLGSTISPHTHSLSFSPSQNNIFKPKVIFDYLATSTVKHLPLTPNTFSQASKYPEWQAAMTEEHFALLKNKTWSLVPSTPSQNVVECKWVFRVKHKPDGSIERYKARLVVKGFHQRPGIDFHSTFSPVIKTTTIRLILSLAVSLKWPLRQLDVNNAFLQGSNNSQVYATIKLLGDRFSIKDLGLLLVFLGVEVIQHDHGLTLTQSSFIADILNKFNMLDANSVITHLSTSEILSLDDGSPSADATLYRQVIGSLQYLTFTQPDISFAVNKLTQFQHSPSTKHWQATKRLLRYLKETITYGLHFKRGNSSQLLAYSNADWGGIPDTRHFTSAYVIFLGKNPISWCSNKQRTVAKSSTEAEYRAVASVVAELNWLTNLLQGLRVKLPCPPKVFCDNIGVTYLCRNPVFHSRMKHVAIDFHFVRDQVESGRNSVHHIPIGAQLADALTKALPKRSFVHPVSNIGLKQIEPMLRGHDKDKDIES
ncbi:hypothetical protein KY285_000460 [Solanum tuberosum]|nr:hypothetical protein KY285_000460 [Solanum tuberosum]